jgi:hypothetical protein
MFGDRNTWVRGIGGGLTEMDLATGGSDEPDAVDTGFEIDGW